MFFGFGSNLGLLVRQYWCSVRILCRFWSRTLITLIFMDSSAPQSSYFMCRVKGVVFTLNHCCNCFCTGATGYGWTCFNATECVHGWTSPCNWIWPNPLTHPGSHLIVQKKKKKRFILFKETMLCVVSLNFPLNKWQDSLNFCCFVRWVELTKLLLNWIS